MPEQLPADFQRVRDQMWTPRPLVEHLREQERHNVTVITVGSKYEVYVRSQHLLTCKPWTTLSNPCNKVRGKYNCKEVFLLPFFMRLSVCICLWCCVVVMLNDDVDDYITVIDRYEQAEIDTLIRTGQGRYGIQL